MDTSKVKQMLSTEDIVCLVTEGLGSNGNLWDASGAPIFRQFVTTHRDMVVINYITIQILKCFIVIPNVVQWMFSNLCKKLKGLKLSLKLIDM